MSIKGPSFLSVIWSTVILSVTLVWLPEFGFAQNVAQPVTPPLGYQYGVPGPVPNPFGTPPMAIGPAPAAGYPVFVSPFAPPPPYGFYPPPGYYAVPYWGRPPTPFQSQAPAPASAAAIAPSPIDWGTPSGQITERQPLAIKASSPPPSIGNFRLSVSESFLNRLIARNEQRPGEVRDFILGAQVTGRQLTDTQLRLDLVPSVEKMRAALVLNGVTQSQTTGVTPQAMVDTASQQRFVAIKEIYFDGTSFSTRHATVHVQARNQTLGAMTRMSGTLFGSIADRIAYREAERRKPEAEAIARDKVAEKVYPLFDNEIDKQLANANDQLDSVVRRRLEAAGLMPSQQQVSSSDADLNYAAQIGGDNAITTPVPSEILGSTSDGIHLWIHESLLNVLVAKSGMKGLKMTDQQIKTILAPYEYKTAAPEAEKAESSVALPGMDSFVTDIEFDENDPLTIRLEKGRAIVTMRALFKPAGQKLLPPLEVTVDYETELIGDKIVIKPGNVGVKPQTNADDSNLPAFALGLLKQAIQASMVPMAVDRILPATFWSFGGAVPQITTIRTQDGWAAISIQ